MSGGLKMLNSEITPSKDNLLISSLEDIHIHTVDLETSLNPESPDGKMTRSNNGLNNDKVNDHENENTTSKKQQNILLVQQRHQRHSSIINNQDGKGDERIEYQSASEGHNVVDHQNNKTGPQIVEVDDEETGRSCCSFMGERRRLEQIRKKKQDERTLEFTRLQTVCKLEGDNKMILNLGWEELVQALQKRELSASSVLEAYTSKALEATSKFNNVTDFIPQAFAWAKELDNMPEPKGPLHGIPFCVKDDTNVEGLDTTLGYVKRLYKPASENAVLVKILMDLGAIPFCKTNVPQTLFTYGSDNPIFGATTNCFNPKLSPGGSSSGTGSLVGAHGCPFGTGTDIGGSLRIPAHFNGVASIKPTIGRLSDKGIVSSLPNLVGLNAVPGIIGQTPAIVSTVFKGICEDFRQHKYDARIPPIPWDNAIFQSREKLRIGYFSSLPYFPAMGDTEEVCLRAKSTLESLGHTLVPFTMPDQYRYMHVLAKFLLADHNQHFNNCLKNEEVAQSIQLSYLTALIPARIQRMMKGLLTTKLFPFMYSKRTSAMFGAGASSSTDVWENQGEKNQIIEEVHAEWSRLNLDAVISPVFPFPAPLINYPGLLPMAVVYAMIWNLVDFPAGVVPFGRESGKNFDSYDDEGDVALKTAKKATKDSIGAPIGVQVIGLPYKEEMVLRLMVELEQFSYKH